MTGGAGRAARLAGAALAGAGGALPDLGLSLRLAGLRLAQGPARDLLQGARPRPRHACSGRTTPAPGPRRASPATCSTPCSSRSARWRSSSSTLRSPATSSAATTSSGRRLVIGVLAATLLVPARRHDHPDRGPDRGARPPQQPLGDHPGAGRAAAMRRRSCSMPATSAACRRSSRRRRSLDGAGFLTIFFSVMLPLAGPVTATVAVLTFLAAWNAS